jgi:hypothetical protein
MPANDRIEWGFVAAENTSRRRNRALAADLSSRIRYPAMQVLMVVLADDVNGASDTAPMGSGRAAIRPIGVLRAR